MAEFGAAASVLGVIQFGISFAKTLTTYVGEFQSAAKDIYALASEVEVTYGQVKDLQGLLEDNKVNKGFSEGSRIAAERCCLQAEELGEELWKMLRKSDIARPENREIERDDINLSLFHQILWPRFQPRVEEAKSKFLLLKINIAISMASWHGQGGLPGGSANVTPQALAALKKSKKVAIEDLRATRLKRKLDKRRNRSSRHARFAPEPVNLQRRQYSGGSYYSDRQVPLSYTTTNPYGRDYNRDRNIYDADNASITTSLYDDIEQAILENQALEEAKRTTEAKDKEKTETEAVESFKKTLMNELRDSQRQADDTRKRLSKLFGLPSNAKQIDDYVAESQSHALQANEVGKLASEMGVPMRAENSEKGERLSDTVTVVSKRSRFLSMFSSRQKDASREHAIPPGENSLPVMLQQPELPGGRSFIAIVLSEDGSTSRTQVPSDWLEHILRLQEKETMKKGMNPNVTVKTYAMMSSSDRHSVATKLEQESINPNEASLVYARELESRGTGRRKALSVARYGRGGQTWQLYYHSYLLVFLITKEADGSDLSSNYRSRRSSASTCKHYVEPAAEKPAPSPLEAARERRISRSRSRAYHDYDDDPDNDPREKGGANILTWSRSRGNDYHPDYEFDYRRRGERELDGYEYAPGYGSHRDRPRPFSSEAPDVVPVSQRQEDEITDRYFDKAFDRLSVRDRDHRRRSPVRHDSYRNRRSTYDSRGSYDPYDPKEYSSRYERHRVPSPRGASAAAAGNLVSVRQSRSRERARERYSDRRSRERSSERQLVRRGSVEEMFHPPREPYVPYGNGFARRTSRYDDDYYDEDDPYKFQRESRDSYGKSYFEPPPADYDRSRERRNRSPSRRSRHSSKSKLRSKTPMPPKAILVQRRSRSTSPTSLFGETGDDLSSSDSDDSMELLRAKAEQLEERKASQRSRSRSAVPSEPFTELTESPERMADTEESMDNQGLSEQPESLEPPAPRASNKAGTTLQEHGNTSALSQAETDAKAGSSRQATVDESISSDARPHAESQVELGEDAQATIDEGGEGLPPTEGDNLGDPQNIPRRKATVAEATSAEDTPPQIDTSGSGEPAGESAST